MSDWDCPNCWYCPNCGPSQNEDGITFLGKSSPLAECIECGEVATNHLPEFVLAMQERIAELKALIGRAPHANTCDGWLGNPCDCWKVGYLQEQSE